MGSASAPRQVVVSSMIACLAVCGVLMAWYHMCAGAQVHALWWVATATARLMWYIGHCCAADAALYLQQPSTVDTSPRSAGCISTCVTRPSRNLEL